MQRGQGVLFTALAQICLMSNQLHVYTLLAKLFTALLSRNTMMAIFAPDLKYMATVAQSQVQRKDQYVGEVGKRRQLNQVEI